MSDKELEIHKYIKKGYNQKSAFPKGNIPKNAFPKGHKMNCGKKHPMWGKPGGFRGKQHSKETKEKMRESFQIFLLKNPDWHRRLWQEPEYVRKVLKARNAKPNKAEIKLNNILQKILPNEYGLNVLGNILILGGKIPDFVNINGDKKIIELNGEYWHSPEMRKETPEERVKLFKKLGWDTLIIWYNELKNIVVLKQKILNFNGS